MLEDVTAVGHVPAEGSLDTQVRQFTLDSPGSVVQNLGHMAADLREAVARCIRVHDLPISQCAVYNNILLPLSRAGITQLQQLTRLKGRPIASKIVEVLCKWSELLIA